MLLKTQSLKNLLEYKDKSTAEFVRVRICGRVLSEWPEDGYGQSQIVGSDHETIRQIQRVSYL